MTICHWCDKPIERGQDFVTIELTKANHVVDIVFLHREPCSVEVLMELHDINELSSIKMRLTKEH